MRWLSRSPPYEKLATTESTEDLSKHPHTLLQPLSRRTLPFHLNSLFFIANLIFLSILLWTAHYITSPNYLLSKTNTYTPLLDRWDFAFHKTKTNASLFNTPYSIYKDDPSPNVDEAWEAIADTPVLVISREDVVKMGKDPEYVVGVPEEFGYGSDKYFAVSDAQHLLHCLNEVRKFAYYDYYYAPKYGPSSSDLPPLVAAHRSHCVGVLLDALTCQPSLNMVVWEWMEGQHEPWPDFDTWKMCVNHEAFYEWQVKEQVEMEKIKGWDWGKGRGKERTELEELKGLREGNGSGHGGHKGHWS